jgi:hypothetical protein
MEKQHRSANSHSPHPVTLHRPLIHTVERRDDSMTAKLAAGRCWCAGLRRSSALRESSSWASD